MSMHITAIVNEDGIIEPEVVGTRMDIDEYLMRAAKIKVAPEVITALEAMGACMDETTVRVYARPTDAKCVYCGDDAYWKAESWMRTFPVYLCHDHQQQHESDYKCFDRI